MYGHQAVVDEIKELRKDIATFICRQDKLEGEVTTLQKKAALEGATTDKDKVELIVNKLQIPPIQFTVERLGQPNNDNSLTGRIRALLLTITDDISRKNLLGKCDKLNQIKPLENVFIKRLTSCFPPRMGRLF